MFSSIETALSSLFQFAETFIKTTASLVIVGWRPRPIRNPTPPLTYFIVSAIGAAAALRVFSRVFTLSTERFLESDAQIQGRALELFAGEVTGWTVTAVILHMIPLMALTRLAAWETARDARVVRPDQKHELWLAICYGSGMILALLVPLVVINSVRVVFLPPFDSFMLFVSSRPRVFEILWDAFQFAIVVALGCRTVAALVRHLPPSLEDRKRSKRLVPMALAWSTMVSVYGVMLGPLSSYSLEQGRAFVAASRPKPRYRYQSDDFREVSRGVFEITLIINGVDAGPETRLVYPEGGEFEFVRSIPDPALDTRLFREKMVELGFRTSLVVLQSSQGNSPVLVLSQNRTEWMRIRVGLRPEHRAMIPDDYKELVADVRLNLPPRHRV